MNLENKRKHLPKLSGSRHKDEKPEEVKSSLDDEINDLTGKNSVIAIMTRTISGEDCSEYTIIS